MIQAYEDLSRKLWQLEGLPLSITSVQGAHQVIRCTQVTTLTFIFARFSFMHLADTFIHQFEQLKGSSGLKMRRRCYHPDHRLYVHIKA